MIKISVIIPVYNVEKYLRECLDSLINQSFMDFEVICIDDGSTDKSYKILEEYSQKDSRIKVLKQEHNGAGAARNLGIEIAKGKYIQFLDSDDYFEPDMLEELYNTAEEFGADMAVCSARKVDEAGNIVESGNPHSPIKLEICPINKPFSKKDFPKDIFSLFSSAPWNKLYLKSLIVDNNLKFQNISSCNDIGFVRIADACAERIVVINKELINYRFNRSGSIANTRAAKTTNLLKAGGYVKDFLVKNNLYELLKDAHINAMKKTVSWEISMCSDEQYKNFLAELKQLNDWKVFLPVLRKEYITPDYIKNFIGDKKVMFWGASLFLEDVLKSETEKNLNVLGVIDKNSAKWGKSIGSYEIFPPESLNTLKPDAILLMVHSNYEVIYPALKKELGEKWPEIELLPNIFEAEEL